MVLAKFFGFSDSILTKVLGVFAVFISLGWIAGTAVLFLPLTFWVLAAVFAANAVAYIFLGRWAKKAQSSNVIISTSSIQALNEMKDPLTSDDLASEETPGAKFGVLAFLILVFYGFYLLYTSRTGNTLSTPWQTIKPEYVFIFFFSTLILGILIFCKLSAKTILFFLMLQTFLLHSYLPLTHKLLYGADGWRHIANEQRFLEGKGFKEAELSSGKSEIVNLKSKIGELSYANFWALSVILVKVFNTDLLTVIKWFLPILWSVIFPLLLFEIGITLDWTKKNSLFFSWLGLLPFAWQAAGSFTLPVSLGLLGWMFFALLILKRVQSPRKEQVLILALAGLGSVFGYILYFILFWLGWGVMELLRKVKSKNIISIFAVFAVASFMPAIELLFGYSQFNSKINWLAQIKQVLGNFSGYYLASGPRPHDIVTGNVIFNQTPLAAFVANFFTQRPWWIFIFMICFFAIFVYGLWQAWRSRQMVGLWLVVMAKGIIISYIISNYFLTGQHILTRRLDGVLALFLIIGFFYGLKDFLNKKHIPSLVVVVLSMAIAASYSLGPDTYAVSSNQYDAAGYVWSQEKNNSAHCVLGDTYSLLALEAVSGKEIIGGGFPINASFAQPEREELFKQMNIAINNNLLSQTAALTKTDHCWFVGETDNFSKQGILGNSVIFGDVAVVRYNTDY